MKERFTWADLRAGREKERAAQVKSIMRLVEQRPFLDVFVGGMPPYSAIEAARRYPLCDGVLIIFDNRKEK